MFVSRTVLYRNGNVRNHFCAFLFSHLCPPDLRVTPDSEPSFFILHFSALPLDLKSHSVATCRNFHREKERGLRDSLTARSDRKESTSLLMTKRNETKTVSKVGSLCKRSGIRASVAWLMVWHGLARTFARTLQLFIRSSVSSFNSSSSPTCRRRRSEALKSSKTSEALCNLSCGLAV